MKAHCVLRHIYSIRYRTNLVSKIGLDENAVALFVVLTSRTQRMLSSKSRLFCSQLQCPVSDPSRKMTTSQYPSNGTKMVSTRLKWHCRIQIAMTYRDLGYDKQRLQGRLAPSVQGKLGFKVLRSNAPPAPQRVQPTALVIIHNRFQVIVCALLHPYPSKQTYSSMLTMPILNHDYVLSLLPLSGDLSGRL